MPWNNGDPGGPTGGAQGGGSGSGGRGPNPSPWGTPDRGADNKSNDRPPPRPQGPWGNGQRPGGGGGGGQPPDLDDLIARGQNFIRGLLPPGFGGGGFPRGGGAFGGGRGVALLIAVVFFGWLASGFYRVQPDEQGVVLRFGRFDRTTLPGLNYHVPWPVESVLRPAVTRINRVEVGYRSTGSDLPVVAGRRGSTQGDRTEEGLMLTGDENIIDINFAVFWRIRDAGAYLFNTRSPGYTVKSAAESVMREVIGRTPIQPALTDARARIEADVFKGVQSILDQYGSGVEITQIQLQKVDPPSAVIDSFRDVQRANTDADRMRNEAESFRNDIIPRARGDAARLIAEAEGAKQSSIAEATGQAQRFLSVLNAYNAAKDVTMQRLYIETMQDILTHTPTVIVDNKLQGVVPYLPLNDLGRTPAASAAPAAQVNPAAPYQTPAAGAPRVPVR